MEINYYAVLVCAVVSMVLGFIWYGPIFGKKWQELNGVEAKSPKELKEMQKGAGPLFLLQFLLTLFQAYVLAHYIAGWTEASGVENSMWIWAAFVIPTLAGACMWTSESKKNAWHRFLIQGGYQLLLFVTFGLILGAWPAA